MTFLVSTAVTYAAHHKWLTNVAKWWAHQESLPVLTGEAAPKKTEILAKADKAPTGITEQGSSPSGGNADAAWPTGGDVGAH